MKKTKTFIKNPVCDKDITHTFKRQVINVFLKTAKNWPNKNQH